MLRSITHKVNKDMCCWMYDSRGSNMAGAYDHVSYSPETFRC